MFVFALLPVMTTIKGMSMADLPGYVSRGELGGGAAVVREQHGYVQGREPCASGMHGTRRSLFAQVPCACAGGLHAGCSLLRRSQRPTQPLGPMRRPRRRPGAAGFTCLRGLTPPCGSDCTGAPLVPLAYVATNLVFNIAALSLIRTAGNVVMSLVMSALVPVTIWAFTVGSGAGQGEGARAGQARSLQRGMCAGGGFWWCRRRRLRSAPRAVTEKPAGVETQCPAACLRRTPHCQPPPLSQPLTGGPALPAACATSGSYIPGRHSAAAVGAGGIQRPALVAAATESAAGLAGGGAPRRWGRHERGGELTDYRSGQCASGSTSWTNRLDKQQTSRNEWMM